MSVQVSLAKKFNYATLDPSGSHPSATQNHSPNVSVNARLPGLTTDSKTIEMRRQQAEQAIQ